MIELQLENSQVRFRTSIMDMVRVNF